MEVGTQQKRRGKFKMVTEKIRNGRPTQYPWEKWLRVPEGKSTKKSTIKPEHYSASQRSMCVMIRQNARLLNVNVSVFPQEDGSIVVRALGPR